MLTEPLRALRMEAGPGGVGGDRKLQLLAAVPKVGAGGLRWGLRWGPSLLDRGCLASPDSLLLRSLPAACADSTEPGKTESWVLVKELNLSYHIGIYSK